MSKYRVKVTRADGSVDYQTAKQVRKGARTRGAPWDQRRAAYWRTHDKVCVKCGFGTEKGDDLRRIHLHHIKYGVKLGTESDGQLMGLCERCHNGVHNLARSTGWPVWMATYRYRPPARGWEQAVTDDERAMREMRTAERENAEAFERAFAADA